MKNPEVRAWLKSLSPKSLTRVIFYFFQDESPKRALECCEAMFWTLGYSRPRDFTALVTNGRHSDSELLTWRQMPEIYLDAPVPDFD